ncbi:MAG: redoxin domain-containing protein [Bdellovibrionales bacterium]|nr:redoxin domain-containing protein [Bdellovibrionales bacterium]
MGNSKTRRKSLSHCTTKVGSLFSLILFSFICVFLFNACSSKPAIDPNSNLFVPKYTKFVTLDGKIKTFGDLRGKKTVVIFWTQWCRYSRPVIAKIDKYAASVQNRRDLYFLAISLDKEQDFEILKEEISRRELNNLNHAFSGAEFYDEAFMVFGGSNLPLVYIIDEKGKLIAAGDSEEVLDIL